MSKVTENDSIKIPKSEMDADSSAESGAENSALDLDINSGKSATSEIASISDPIELNLSSDLPVDKNKYPDYRDNIAVTSEIWDPIFRATHYKNLGGMMKALNAGSDIEYRTTLSYTALHNASLHNFYEGVELLLERGADINAVTPEDENHPNSTALMLAAGGGYIRIVKLLLDNGANYKHANDEGFTALHRAVCKSRDEIVEILLDLPEVDLHAKTNWGFSLLQLAEKRKKEDEQLTDVAERTRNLEKIDNVIKMLEKAINIKCE